jgi:Methyltransferase domain
VPLLFFGQFFLNATHFLLVQFEDGIVDFLGKHCEIHVFDPGNFARQGDVETKNIHFHQWGLASSYEQNYKVVTAAVDFETKSFQDTLQVLGHENRTIHVFKIDCERCEW